MEKWLWLTQNIQLSLKGLTVVFQLKMGMQTSKEAAQDRRWLKPHQVGGESGGKPQFSQLWWGEVWGTRWDVSWEAESCHCNPELLAGPRPAWIGPEVWSRDRVTGGAQLGRGGVSKSPWTQQQRVDARPHGHSVLRVIHSQTWKQKTHFSRIRTSLERQTRPFKKRIWIIWVQLFCFSR